jgi:hypothetical protein
MLGRFPGAAIEIRPVGAKQLRETPASEMAAGTVALQFFALAFHARRLIV